MNVSDRSSAWQSSLARCHAGRLAAAVMTFLGCSQAHLANASTTFNVNSCDDSGPASLRTAIGAARREIVFTSGGTEANNLALFGTLNALPRPAHVIVSAIEHSAVLPQDASVS